MDMKTKVAIAVSEREEGDNRFCDALAYHYSD